MKNRQREFMVETTMYSMLGVMTRHRDDINFTLPILNQILMSDGSVISDAVTMAIKEGYIDVANDRITTTEEGIDAYETATYRNAIVSDAETEFRNEVLTGTTYDGKQTIIDRAALPGKSFSRDNGRIENNSIHGIEERRRLEQFVAATGETLDSVREGLESGRIGVCRNGGRPHFGKFHKNGRVYRTICARCLAR